MKKSQIIGIVPGKLNKEGYVECETPSNSSLIASSYAKIEENNVYIALNGENFVSCGNSIFKYYCTPIIKSCNKLNVPSCGNIQFSLLLKNPVLQTNNYYIRFNLNGKIIIQNAYRYKNLEDENALYKIECNLPKLDDCPLNGIDAIVDLSHNGIDFSKDDNSLIKIHYFFTPLLIKIIPQWGYIDGNDEIQLIFDNIDNYIDEIIKDNRKIYAKWSWRSERYADCQIITPIYIKDKKFYTRTPLCKSDSLSPRIDISFDNDQYCVSSVFFHYFKNPTFEKIDPISGPLNGNTIVNIYGSGFVNTKSIKMKILSYYEEEIIDVEFISLKQLKCTSIISYFISVKNKQLWHCSIIYIFKWSTIFKK